MTEETKNQNQNQNPIEAKEIYSNKGKKYSDVEKVKLESYDFRNPLFLAESELRQLRICHDSFVQVLADRLSMFLRMDFTLNVESINTVAYKNLLEVIGSPTHISLFNVESLNGVGIIELKTTLAMTIVDRILGGKGASDDKERELTEIEMVLIDDATQIILEEWCNKWSKVRKFKGQLVGKESSGRFLKTAAEDTIMLLSKIHMKWDNKESILQIAVPYGMIESLVHDLIEQERKYIQMGRITKRKRWSPSYNQLHIPTLAEWDAYHLTVRDYLELKVGDILELPVNMLKQTRLRLRDIYGFVGEIGSHQGKSTVTITQKLDDLNSL